MNAGTKTVPTTFDVYISKTDPKLRIATAVGAGLPVHVKMKDWRLTPAGSSVLHSDVPRDVAVKGYCYFQVTKGN